MVEKLPLGQDGNMREESRRAYLFDVLLQYLSDGEGNAGQLPGEIGQGYYLMANVVLQVLHRSPPVIDHHLLLVFGRHYGQPREYKCGCGRVTPSRLCDLLQKHSQRRRQEPEVSISIRAEENFGRQRWRRPGTADDPKLSRPRGHCTINLNEAQDLLFTSSSRS